jgi:glycosyltransferase involved in cell wall biosynthesis
MKKPFVTVVMSVFNGDKYLEESVESILNQTYKEFEFIIINDGSTDKTSKILNQYQDDRLLIINQKNQGLSKSLNLGIRKSKCNYIARMDADDISYPERLKEQIKFLKKNDEIIVLGTQTHIISEDGEIIYSSNLPINDIILKTRLPSHCPFYHGSTMFKKVSAINAGLYPEEYAQYFEDIIFWRKMADFGKFTNLNQYLYKYRIVPNSNNFLAKTTKTKSTSINKMNYIKDRFNYGLINNNNKAIIRINQAYYKLKIGKLYIEKSDNIKKGRLYLIESLKQYPFILNTWLNFIVSLFPIKIIKLIKKETLYNL